MIGEKLQRIASNKIDGKIALLNKKTPDMQPRKFGTFGGVFTPSLLTILGVIMFLRFATVVGYAGLWNALLILLVAKTISLITGLSVASIATNMRVRGGGEVG
jgi:amino acid transporter